MSGDVQQPCGVRRPGWGIGVGRHRLPCLLTEGHPGPHRDAFLAVWPRTDEDRRLAPPAPAEDEQPTAAGRTVTVQTLDHGEVTMPEPSWCTGHDRHPVGYRADVQHVGPITGFDVSVRGEEVDYMQASLAQRPFSAILRRTPYVWLNVDGMDFEVEPTDLDAIAAQLVEHATLLRHTARSLSYLLADGGGL